MISAWTISYFTASVEKFVLCLPDDLAASYARVADMMVEFGAHLGLPHTRAIGGGLFELRLSGSEGIARVFFCLQVGKRIVLLHGFIKKTQGTPQSELHKARKLLAEAKSK